MDERELRTGLRGRILNSKLVVNKVPETGQEELAHVLYTPRAWLKGEHMSEGGQERLFPWEKLLWGTAAFLRNTSGQFDGRDRLWRTVFGVQPTMIMVQNVANTLWDGINDPIVGHFMDRHPFKDNTYRWFMRINHIIGQFLTLFFMLDLGLTPLQRVVMFGVIQAARNVFGTMSDIAGEKFHAGITPLSEERAKLEVWQHTFHKIAYPIANMPQYLQGFIVGENRYVWTDKRIFITGFTVLIPLALAGGIIHTFVRNRVQFDHAKNAAHTKENAQMDKAEKLTVREMLAVFRHNKYLLYWMIANFFRTFLPSYDSWFYWRYMVPNTHWPLIGEVAGPGLSAVMGQFTGMPITFLVPFMRQIMHAVGGPKNTLIMQEGGGILVRLAQYFIGLSSRGRIVGFFALDTYRETVWPIANMGARVLNFEMLDYVEYKTGIRSEGITRAITGFIDKMIKSNINTASGELFQQWARVYEIDGNLPHPPIPERFARWAWPVWILGDVVAGSFFLIARIAFPYQYGQNVEIEAELAARRAAEAQVRAEMEDETATV
ncbi:MAG: MFS transporter [Oscillospiraceae bacterium]|nr:MFS transporter [Oscillospiraceae bacterium]